VGRFTNANLKGFASRSGLDRATFDGCLDNSGDKLAIITAESRQAKNVGITGTPSFTLNGVLVAGGAPTSLDGWRKLLDGALSATSAAASSATAAPTGAR
jgi:predicted DsbA family dithiol-disulfide isomerase